MTSGPRKVTYKINLNVIRHYPMMSHTGNVPVIDIDVSGDLHLLEEEEGEQKLYEIFEKKIRQQLRRFVVAISDKAATLMVSDILACKWDSSYYSPQPLSDKDILEEDFGKPGNEG